MLAAAGWAADEPRLEAVAWDEARLPAVFTPQDTLLRAGFPPDSTHQSGRPRLAATFAARPPVADGDLSDWHLVRWLDFGAPGDLVRGTWNGPDDIGARFAVAWTEAGLWLGARLRDDAPAPTPAPPRQQAGIILRIGSESRLVQRYWLGGARSFRVRAGGAVDAWTEVRNRRPEPFAATALGVRGVARPGAARGETAVELFVPWEALYPVLPDSAARLLCDVQAEDLDAGAGKLVTWARRPAGRGDRAPRRAWANLDLAGGPQPGTWIVSRSTAHPEIVAEWAVLRWRVPAAAAVELRCSGDGMASRRLAATLPPGPAFLMASGLDGPRPLEPASRRFAVEWRGPGEVPARRDTLYRLPERAAVEAALAAVTAAPPGGADFPAPDDVAVRLRRALAEIDLLGDDWRARRHHGTGILARRAAGWQDLESLLRETELLRDLVQAPADPERRRRFEARWPRRTERGVPVGAVVLRGYRSPLDGSVQPYAVFVSSRIATGQAAPLVVALHDLQGDERTLFEQSTLAPRLESRAWMAVCPYGRGDTQYQGPGERDVLDVLQHARAALPVDGRRIHLTGLGMGGTGAWLVSLRHPGLFASACVVSGYFDLEQVDVFGVLRFHPDERPWFEAHDPARMLRGDLRTAYRVAHGERDAVISVVNARIAAERLKQAGVPHEVRIDPEGDHGIAYFEAELDANLDFMARQARSEPGAVEPARWSGAGGPVADVFERGPFAIVYGTRPAPAASGGDDAGAPSGPDADRRVAELLAEDWAGRFAGRARVLPDSAVTDSLLRTANLVVVGDVHSNALLERWGERLPIRIDELGYVLEGRTYPGPKFGVLFAAPNPEFAGRSLVIVAGMATRLGAFARSPLLWGADYAFVSAAGIVPAGNFAAATGP